MVLVHCMLLHTLYCEFSAECIYCILFYLAVSGSDHVYVVADQFECESSVHQSKASLKGEAEISQLEIRPRTN